MSLFLCCYSFRSFLLNDCKGFEGEVAARRWSQNVKTLQRSSARPGSSTRPPLVSSSSGTEERGWDGIRPSPERGDTPHTSNQGWMHGLIVENRNKWRWIFLKSKNTYPYILVVSVNKMRSSKSIPKFVIQKRKKKKTKSTFFVLLTRFQFSGKQFVVFCTLSYTCHSVPPPLGGASGPLHTVVSVSGCRRRQRGRWDR